MQRELDQNDTNVELIPIDLAEALVGLSGMGLIGKSDFGGLFKISRTRRAPAEVVGEKLQNLAGCQLCISAHGTATFHDHC
ncbi:hypothetical protein [Labrenzia sp. VG12]|uniref:hypothetical protein n=1 Tax=Labrenzia sp. VG12 TaxID=2021862 RepID=UPI000B8C6233|nr:hypothetical protein [Labrenzia sp. VG12]ASP32852.1 hypothetical protein CHH27_05990 [Labrenzia sp. VG12]